MRYERDPLSTRFDGKAYELLTAAYARRGEWVTYWLPQPGPRATAWMWAHGIFDPYQRDRWGEVRWVRAMKRAVYWQANHYGGTRAMRKRENTGAGTGWGAPVRVEWRTGRLTTRAGYQPAYPVRVRLHPAGAATSRIGRKKSVNSGTNWIDADGHPTFRQSTPDERGYLRHNQRK